VAIAVVWSGGDKKASFLRDKSPLGHELKKIKSFLNHKVWKTDLKTSRSIKQNRIE